MSRGASAQRLKIAVCQITPTSIMFYLERYPFPTAPGSESRIFSLYLHLFVPASEITSIRSSCRSFSLTQHARTRRPAQEDLPRTFCLTRRSEPTKNRPASRPPSCLACLSPLGGGCINRARNEARNNALRFVGRLDRPRRSQPSLCNKEVGRRRASRLRRNILKEHQFELRGARASSYLSIALASRLIPLH